MQMEVILSRLQVTFMLASWFLMQIILGFFFQINQE